MTAPGSPAAPPTVSVVIPVHGVADYVERTVASVADQTRPPVQLVLVDDRGPDDSVPRARAAAAARGLPTTVVEHPENRGLGAARNSGLAVATGDAVLFLDGDDALVADALERLGDALARHDADFASGRTVLVDVHGASIAEVERPYRREVVTGRDFARGLLRDTHRAYASNKLFRRAVLPDDLWDVGRAYEDFAPMLRAARRAPRVALVDGPVLRYTVHPTSISRSFGRHTTDLLAVGDEVRGILAGSDRDRSWRRDAAVHGVLNVALPVATMALRAAGQGAPDDGTPGPDPEVVAAAVAGARARIDPYALASLVGEGRWHSAAAAGVLKAWPTGYARVLARR